MKNRRRRSRRLLPTFPPVARIHGDWQLLPRSLKGQRREVTLSEVKAGQSEGESRAASHLGLLLPQRRRWGWHSAEFPRICGEFQTSVLFFPKPELVETHSSETDEPRYPAHQRTDDSLRATPNTLSIFTALQKTSNKRSNSRRQTHKTDATTTTTLHRTQTQPWRQPGDAAAAQLHVYLWIRSSQAELTLTYPHMGVHWKNYFYKVIRVAS